MNKGILYISYNQNLCSCFHYRRK